MGMTSKGGIKSIQRGLLSVAALSITATATISAVDTSKTELRTIGTEDTAGSNSTGSTLVRLSLTNSTTITADRGGNTGLVEVSWELTEWY